MKNYSIAIFGSSLRKDFDKYSDRDLLIVANDYKTLKELGRKYSKEDWSISYYTYSKISYLAKSGSLFIKHLQNESHILDDYKERLKDVLLSYSPKSDYKQDVLNAKEFFKILKFIPYSSLGFAWFCDCFYVGLRNFLVFRNAEDSIYEFSFNKLLKRLQNNGVINASDFNALTELRVIKRYYREGNSDVMPSKKFVEKIIDIGKKIGLIKSSIIVKEAEFKILTEQTIMDKNYDSYQRLRLVEGYYTAQSEIIPELKKIICNPQFYAVKCKNDDFTMSLISKIKETTHNKGSARHSLHSVSNEATSVFEIP